jgi:uncharacterized membrane protein
MDIQSMGDSEKRQLALLVAVIVVAVVVIIGFGRRYVASQSPSLAQELDLDKHPIPSWVSDDARQCNGDITKLSPAEQQKVYAAYPGQGGRIIIGAAYQMQH